MIGVIKMENVGKYVTGGIKSPIKRFFGKFGHLQREDVTGGGKVDYEKIEKERQGITLEEVHNESDRKYRGHLSFNRAY